LEGAGRLKTGDCSAYPSAERGVYELVARRYLSQFYPSFEFHETTIEVHAGGESFRALGRQPITEGWRALFAKLSTEDRGDDERRGVECDADDQPLPLLQDGETVTCAEVAIVDKQTTPPKRFTEGSLIHAMTGIARFVEDPKIRQLLRETDGIGTPATQAQIVETLFERRFIEKKGREVFPTHVGRALIEALPEIATKPDMTALWEAAMRRIADGQMPLDAFLGAALDQLRELVATGRALRVLRVPSHSRGEPRTGGEGPAVSPADVAAAGIRRAPPEWSSRRAIGERTYLDCHCCERRSCHPRSPLQADRGPYRRRRASHTAEARDGR
jgi:DNA topoisomerase III